MIPTPRLGAAISPGTAAPTRRLAPTGHQAPTTRPTPPDPDVGPAYPDRSLIAGLRCGDEAAFARLWEREHVSMLRIARLYTRSTAEAEDAVQETWIAVIRGLPGFEGRSSLRTWMFRILSNIARTRAIKDRRTIPFSQIVGGELASTEPLVDPSRLVPDEDREWAGHWDTTVSDWGQRGDQALMSAEMLACLAGVMRTLPAAQREVLRLRDVEGWAPTEVSAALRITRNNQRVLLHRARCRARAALEEYFDG